MIIFFTFIALILVLYFLTPLPSSLSQENIENLKIWIRARGVFAPFIFIALYVLATVLCLPGSVLTLIAGLIFGVLGGTVTVIIASNTGALCAFLITRYLGRETAEKFLRGRLVTLDEGIERNAFHIVLWLRLIPLFPFNALNYALGLTKIKTSTCVVANFLGMLPGTFVYVSLGNAASHFSLRDPQVWKDPQVWVPFLLIILLSFLPLVFKKQKHKLEQLRHKKDF